MSNTMIPFRTNEYGALIDEKAYVIRLAGTLSVFTDILFNMVVPFKLLVKFIMHVIFYFSTAPYFFRYTPLDPSDDRNIPIICAQLSRWIYIFSYRNIFLYNHAFSRIPEISFNLTPIADILPLDNSSTNFNIHIKEHIPTNRIFIIAQGTTLVELDDWMTNFNAFQETFAFSDSIGGFNQQLRAHTGFIRVTTAMTDIKYITDTKTEIYEIHC